MLLYYTFYNVKMYWYYTLWNLNPESCTRPFYNNNKEAAMDKEEIRHTLLMEMGNFIASYKNGHASSADQPFKRRACAERLDVFQRDLGADVCGKCDVGLPCSFRSPI